MLDEPAATVTDAVPGLDLPGLAPAASTAFFFDVDGTLLEIMPQPGDVVADVMLRKLLDDLRHAADGALALVSGRQIADLDRIFAPFLFTAAGAHGAEMRCPDGTRRQLDPALLEAVRAPATEFVQGHTGLLLEDKGAALAIHFRQRPDLATEVAAFLARFERDGLKLQHGKMVAELKPAGVDKGHAIATLMRMAPFLGRKPVFVGDDLTDEAGFRVVNAMGGLTVRIGAPGHPTEARHALPDPASLRAALRRLGSATRDAEPGSVS